MSRETREYLGSLTDGYNEQGPQINWTRGFEGDNDQYNNYNHQPVDGTRSTTEWDTTSDWDTTTETNDWND